MITHFQTCLYVRLKSTLPCGKDIIYSIQKIVFSWICTKEARSYSCKMHDLPVDVMSRLRNSFFRKLDTYLFSWSRSTLRTGCYLEGESSGKESVKAWASRYIHDDANPANGRRWIVDIGLNRLEGNVCVMYITVSHEKDKYFLGETQQSTLPDVSIPGVVKKLIDSRILDVSLDKRFVLPLGKSVYTVTTVHAGELLFDWIDSYLRRYVVIVFNGKLISKYATNLHKLVQGKAIVISIDENPEMKDYMGRINRDKKHQVPFNCFRVFFPAVKGEAHTAYNKIFKLDSVKYAVEIVGRSLLSNYMLNCHEGVNNIEKIGHLITLSKLQSHKAAHLELVSLQQNESGESVPDEKDKIISSLKSDIETIWEEVAEEADNHRHALEAQKQECKRYQKRTEELTRQLEEVKRTSTTKEQALQEWAREGFPDNLKELLLYAEKMMPSRLIVLASALKSAEDASYNGPLSKAWDMLTSLGSYLYDKKYGGGRISETEFGNENPCELSMTEGRMTKRDSELLKQREVIYKGKPYAITPHLKFGTKQPKLLRLYFQFVEDEKKIIIGHFGDHLDNRTSKSMK